MSTHDNTKKKSVSASAKGFLYGSTWKRKKIADKIVDEKVIALRDVAFGNNTFVTVGESGVVFTSGDGKTWKRRDSGYDYKAHMHLYGVAYGGEGTFVVVGKNQLIIRSTDNGKNWKTINKPGEAEIIWKVAYGNGMYVAIGFTGGIWKSTDGKKWEQIKKLQNKALRNITFGDGKFLVGARSKDGGRGYMSADGVSWSGSFNIGTSCSGLCYYNGLWIATGHQICTSTDGKNWETLMDLKRAGRKENLYSCVGAPQSFIIGGDSGVVFNSPNGSAWKERSSGTKRLFLGMAFGHDIVVGVGTGKPKDPYCTHYTGKEPEPDKSITVTSPNGGENWPVGSKHDITWESSGKVGHVRLEYSVDNGNTWEVFDSVAKNDGIRPWVVPDTPSNSCKIRISEVDDPAISDTSNKAFKISKVASITIIKPNGGEEWEIDETYDITWKSSGTVGHVKLEYSVDNGKTWLVFDSVAKNDGIRPWQVPDKPSAKCSIRISSVDNPGIADTSDTTFAIIEPSKIIPVSPGTNKISEAVLELEQGGVVELGVGTYTQSEPIILPTEVTVFSIKGKGLGATIIECSDCNGIEKAGISPGVRQCDISGLTLIASKTDNKKYTGIELHGDGSDQTGNPNIIIRDVGVDAGDGNSYWDIAIHILDAAAPLIENIHVKGADGLKGVGIQLEGCAAAVAAGGKLGQLDKAVNIRDCTKVKLANMDISVVNKGVNLIGNTRHVMVNNCSIGPVNRYALNEQKSMDEGAAGYHVINGGCYGFSPDAKELSHLVSLQNDGSVVNGIITNGNGTNTNGLTIRAKLPSGAGLVNGIKVNGCMFRNLTTGIYLLNGKECTVTGNICENTANGIFIGKDSQNNKLVANIGSITDQGKDNQVI